MNTSSKTMGVTAGVAGFCFILAVAGQAGAQQGGDDTPDLGTSVPKQIDFTRTEDTVEERLDRLITLDVRDIAVIDVIKFLAIKGDFNLVTAATVQGRATFYLKSVTIRDALEIAVLSNRLAYVLDNNIIRLYTQQEYEAIYGKSFGDKKEVEIIKLKYAKPSYVLATLDSIKSARGRIIIDEETGTVVLIDLPETIDKMKDALSHLETPMQTFVYSLQYAKADVAVNALRARLEAQAVGNVTVDERTNQLIVRAYPERRKEVEEMIESLDKPTKEVLIDVRFLEVVFKPRHDAGIDWKLDFRDSKNKFLRRTEVQNILLNNSSPPSPLGSNYGRMIIGDFDKNQFELAVRALEQVSTTKILSNPSLLVTNNEEAQIHVGDTVPYIISTTSGTGDNAITSEDVRFVDVGLQLNVTPTINDDGMITMTLKPEFSTVSSTVSSQGGGIPQVNKTSVQTTVMVQDGTTIVLGGLKKQNKVVSEKGIPGLMHVPLVKKLFSFSSETIETTEIVIFITPHIVSGDKGYIGDRDTIKPTLDEGVPGKILIPPSGLKIKS